MKKIVKNIKRAKVKNYNLNVTKILVSDFKNVFYGIFNFTVGILVVRSGPSRFWTLEFSFGIVHTSRFPDRFTFMLRPVTFRAAHFPSFRPSGLPGPSTFNLILLFENIPGLSFNDTKLIFLAILTGDFGFSVICVVFENDFLAADNRSDDITWHAVDFEVIFPFPFCLFVWTCRWICALNENFWEKFMVFCFA